MRISGIGKLELEFSNFQKPDDVNSNYKNENAEFHGTVAVSTEIPSSSIPNSKKSSLFTIYQIGGVLLGILVIQLV